MNRPSKRGSASKRIPKRTSKTTSGKTRKTPRGTGRRRPALGILLVLYLPLLGLAGFMGLRLVEMSRTLRDQTEQIEKLQGQLLNARTRESIPEEPEQSPAAPTTPEYTARQRTILKVIVNTPDIGRLIPQKPSLGGQWRCFSEDQVFFLDRNHVAFSYEDGHTRGAAIVKVGNPLDRSTWEVIWSGPL